MGIASPLKVIANIPETLMLMLCAYKPHLARYLTVATDSLLIGGIMLPSELSINRHMAFLNRILLCLEVRVKQN